MEREILITGIGGQGVQLAAQVIARAATIEGRSVSFLGLYGGMMRGGNTDSTLVVADRPIESPPIVSRTWSAIAMHDEFWAPIEPKLRPGGVVLVNDATFRHDIEADVAVHRVNATEIASDLGNPLGASLVMTAAFCNMTGVLQLDSLIQAMRGSIPSYRRQHIEDNEAALRAGDELTERNIHPFWHTEVPA